RQVSYPDLESVFTRLNKADTLVWLTPGRNPLFEKANYVIPMKSFTEKNGTFINHAGLEQRIKKGVTVVSEALTLSDASQLFSGKSALGFENASVGATV